MRRLVWEAEAKRDLTEVLGYIGERNRGAADRLRARIVELGALIAARPFAFRPGRTSGTREAVAHPNYLLVYTVEETQVRVLSLVHARRRYPPNS